MATGLISNTCLSPNAAHLPLSSFVFQLFSLATHQGITLRYHTTALLITYHAYIVLTYPIFTKFTLVSYLQEYPLYKNQAAKFLAILDSFLLGVVKFQHGWVVGARDGQNGCF